MCRAKKAPRPKRIEDAPGRDAFSAALTAEAHQMVWDARHGTPDVVLPGMKVGAVRQGTFVVEADTLRRQAGYEAGVDRKLYKQLALGKLEPTAMLDLHGERSDAFMLLFNWLSEAAKQGERVVLIITGKGFGHGEKGDMGVIKSQICEWLARHPMVMAFATAQPEDGGAGALYVALRRWR